MSNNRKPRGYWTKERCKEVASLFNTRVEFNKAYKGAYLKCMRKGWLDEVCSHMKNVRKPDGYWTLEKCQEEALKYNTRSEFQDGCGSAYNASKSGGWLKEVCSHMKDIVKPANYWTKERCIEEGLKYTTRGEFRNESGSCYTIVCKFGWLDEVCSHMDIKFKPKEYWTKERCREIALKCKSRGEFKNEYYSAYNIARLNKWLDEICPHLPRPKPNGYWTYERCKEIASKYKTKKEIRDNDYGCYQRIRHNKWFELVDHLTADASLKDRYVYAFEFIEYNSVYVGLSWDYKVRYRRHLTESDSSVFQFMKDNNLTESDFEFKVLGYYDMHTSGKMEGVYESDYKDKGWNILNKAVTGSLGSSRLIWTKEKCQEEALKYSERKVFSVNSKSAYNSARKNKWLNDICGHMKQVRKKWDKEACRLEALKYKCRSHLKKGTPSAYDKIKIMGWFDDLCSHMVDGNSLRELKWNKEACRLEALKYNTRNEFQKKSGSAYNACRKNKWDKEFFSHFIKTTKPNGYWTYERCKEEASKYKYKSHFQKGCSSAHSSSIKNGWLNEFFPKNN
jgi:hypothetical protein